MAKKKTTKKKATRRKATKKKVAKKPVAQAVVNAYGPPDVVVEGMEHIIARDLEKHKALLERSRLEKQSYVAARSHEIKRKKHYRGLIGGGKFDDDSLKAAMDQIAINIQHFSDKVKLSDDAIEHHTLIVDTLSAQLENQNKDLSRLREHRRRHANNV